MWPGTSRIGLTRPGWTRPSLARWQRLYLRPLPHQQGSLDLSRRGAAEADVGRLLMGSFLNQFDEGAEGVLRVQERHRRTAGPGSRRGVDGAGAGGQGLIQRGRAVLDA